MNKVFKVFNHRIEIKKIKPKKVTFTNEQITEMAMDLYLGKRLYCYYGIDPTDKLLTRMIAYEGTSIREDGKRIVEFKAHDDKCNPVKIDEWQILQEYKEKYPQRYKNFYEIQLEKEQLCK